MKTRELVSLFAMGLAPAVLAQTNPQIGIPVAEMAHLNTSGSGYDLRSGNELRTVIDMEIPGALGKYGLKVERCMQAVSVESNHKWVVNTYSNCFFQAAIVNKYEYTVILPDGNFANFIRQVACPLPANILTAVGTEDVLILNDDIYKSPAKLVLADGTIVRFEGPPAGAPPASDYDTIGGMKLFYGGTSVTDPNGVTTAIQLGPRDAVSTMIAGPARVTDASGRYLQFNRDSDGFLTSVTGSNGDSVTYNWDKSWVGPWAGGENKGYGRLLGVTYADGTSAEYTYTANDGNGVYLATLSDVRSTARMPKVKIVTGNELSDYYLSDPYNYHPNDQKVVVASENTFDGAVVVSHRTGNGPLGGTFTETRGDGASRTVTYGGSTYVRLGCTYHPGDYSSLYCNTYHVTAETDYLGNQWQYDHGEGGGGASNWNLFLLMKVQDPLGRITQYTRGNPYGKITQITRPDGSTASYQYTSINDAYYVSQAVDELGRITTYDRLPNGLISQIHYPDGSTEAWTYNDFSQPTSHRLRNGNTENFTYDGSGLVTRHTLSTGDHIDYTYYGDGHPWKDRIQTVTDPRGNVTTYEYDRQFVNGVQGTTACAGRGLVTKITNPDGSYKSIGYDVYGNKLWEENELRQRTSYTYDCYNRLRTVTDPLGRITETQYGDSDADALSRTDSNPRRIISPAGRITAWIYDGNRRVSLKAEADWSSDYQYWSYQYDAVGNLTKQREQIGGSPGSEVWRDTTYAYDSRNRRRFEYAPLNRTTEWQYDAAGNVTLTRFPDNTTQTKTYDSMNRVQTATDERGFTTTYSYYPSGQVNTITDPRNAVVSHAYDAQDRLTTRTYPGGSYEAWEYDAAGNRSRLRNRSGQWLNYSYDNRNRETHHWWDGGVGLEVNTQYDAASRVTQRTSAGSTVTYSYDAAGQLTEEHQAVSGASTRVLVRQYDQDGNRTRLLVSTQ